MAEVNPYDTIIETLRLMKNVMSEIESRIRFIRENEVNDLNEQLKNFKSNLENLY